MEMIRMGKGLKIVRIKGSLVLSLDKRDLREV